MTHRHVAAYVLLACCAAIGAMALFVSVTSEPALPSANFSTPPTTPAEVDQLNAETEATGEAKNFGYVPDPEAAKEFLQSLPGGKATLREQAPELFDAGNGEAVLLYRALYLAYEQKHPGSKWRVGAQGIGDCVSWGWAHGADVHLAVLWKLGIAEWQPAATEAIYGGSRVEAIGRSSGGWSDGSNGTWAAKWVKNFGIVFRQDYTSLAGDECNLSTYSSSKAKQWGNYGCGGRGDDGRLDNVAKQRPIKAVALVTTWAEAVVAITNGYPISVCSGQGFSSQRDKDGFARPSGSWAHCMCATAIRFDREGVLIQNSWGPSWIGGPKWPDDQPDGSFWCDRRTFERMLSGRDSFAVSGIDGGFRRLNHKLGWDGAAVDVPQGQRVAMIRGDVHDN